MAKKKGKKKLNKGSFPKVLRWGVRLVAGFLALTIVWVLLLRFVDPPFTFLMLLRGIEQRQTDGEWSIRHNWVDYEGLSDNLKRAAIASEDAHFMTHWGFDFQAIQEAYEEKKSGKRERLRGGSTISQQTAKNVFLWPGRSWVRKGFETYFTVLIELLWSKKRILEVYLNMIETGNGLFGMEAAARHYYGQSAEKLTRRQAALLIAILPNPRRWSPAAPTPYLNRRADGIMRYMAHYQIP